MIVYLVLCIIINALKY